MREKCRAETNDASAFIPSTCLTPPPSTMPKPVKPASSSDDSSSDSEPEVKPVSKGKVASVRFGTLNQSLGLPPLSPDVLPGRLPIALHLITWPLSLAFFCLPLSFLRVFHPILDLAIPRFTELIRPSSRP